jgi:formylglycine-generating enzyme required for sulfatase activity
LVTLTKPFYLGMYEVTQEQYEALATNNQSSFKGANLPVESVLWTEAADYAESLMKKSATGLRYRLPTEAEWEYSCRGGRPSSQPFGIGDGTSLSADQANFNFNKQTTCRVDSYLPNAFGLYDMHGNVWEWCNDVYGPYPPGDATDPPGPPGPGLHVSRGGGWRSPAGGCRAAARRSGPASRYSDVGFRLARDPPEAKK